MNGTTTTGRPTGGAPFRVRRAGTAGFAVAGLVVVMLVAVPRFLDAPHLVDRLTVENPTGYDISIDATDHRRQGWVRLGTAHRGTTSTFEEIVDQGDVWIFRFSAQGEDGGELQAPRQQLERDGWRVRVPTEVGEQLKVAGAPLPP
ncbi:MAG TPA: hypothetical protein VM242_01225 [Acidimicrobiales bacterium]|jgi:hypothetical protein|nr:hypothetical protein [Acidimicrobiales bacterium]